MSRLVTLEALYLVVSLAPSHIQRNGKLTASASCSSTAATATAAGRPALPPGRTAVGIRTRIGPMSTLATFEAFYDGGRQLHGLVYQQIPRAYRHRLHHHLRRWTWFGLLALLLTHRHPYRRRDRHWTNDPRGRT